VTTAKPALPKHVRVLDEVDEAIVGVLAVEGRIPNNALAERVGIAPSTCLGRVRGLVERGVIRGFYADIAPEALGHTLQAVIGVRLQTNARGNIATFAQRISALPEVLNVFFLAGADDFLIHVVADGTQSLRDFVVLHLNQNADVAATETNLIFEHLRGGFLRSH
jgi:DNA-binding Lrp family transcriptional regulator